VHILTHTPAHPCTILHTRTHAPIDLSHNTHCITLQHTATYCNTLQHTTTGTAALTLALPHKCATRTYLPACMFSVHTHTHTRNRCIHTRTDKLTHSNRTYVYKHSRNIFTDSRNIYTYSRNLYTNSQKDPIPSHKHIAHVQSGEDTKNQLSLQINFHKGALLLVALLRKEICIVSDMHLRHPVLYRVVFSKFALECLLPLCDCVCACVFVCVCVCL